MFQGSFITFNFICEHSMNICALSIIYEFFFEGVSAAGRAMVILEIYRVLETFPKMEM